MGCFALELDLVQPILVMRGKTISVRFTNEERAAQNPVPKASLCRDKQERLSSESVAKLYHARRKKSNFSLFIIIEFEEYYVL
jgi:hypothetical protein